MTLTIEEKRERKNAYAKLYYRQNRAKILAYQYDHYRKNKPAALAYAKAYAKTPKAKAYRKSEAYREKQRLCGLKPEVKERARQRARDNPSKSKIRWQEAEAGRPRPDRCEVCGATDQPIHFDHCHQRGIFRGWLCKACNNILGFANDDPDRLRKLVVYLDRTKNLIAPQLELPV